MSLDPGITPRDGHRRIALMHARVLRVAPARCLRGKMFSSHSQLLLNVGGYIRYRLRGSHTPDE